MLLFHPGVQKTATTTLQSAFANLSSVQSLGKPNGLDQRYLNFRKAVIYGEEYSFFEKAQPFQKYAEGFDKAVLSDEMFRTTVHSHVAARIHKLFPNAQILITIRNQFTALQSHFVNHAFRLQLTPIDHRSPMIKFSEYLDFCTKRDELSFFNQIDYFKLANAYLHYFGKHRIHVLPFELLSNDADRFYCQIAKILDIDPLEFAKKERTSKQNPGLSARAANYRRLRRMVPFPPLSKVLPKKVIGGIEAFLLKGNGPARVEFSKDQHVAIVQRFGAGNKWIANTFGLALNEWSYPGFE